jgi:exopolysaccharide biosynthesis WecB/TagA/CpsF family protein
MLKSIVAGSIMNSLDSTVTEVSTILERLTIVESRQQEVEAINSIIASPKSVVISFLNQHAFNLAFTLPSFRTALLRSDYVFRDGVGVELCLALLHQRAGLNQNGTDFIPHLLAAAAGKRIAVYGTSGEWLERALAAMRENGVEISTSLDGFRPVSDYVEDVEANDPDLILIGMGMPKQEMVSARLVEMPGRPRIIINGGAILDFYGKRFPRAPTLVRRMRLEWLFRFYKEPRRLAHRYFLGGFTFSWRLYQIWKSRREAEQLMPAGVKTPENDNSLPGFSERRATNK